MSGPETIYVPTIGGEPDTLSFVGRAIGGGIVVNAEWQETVYHDGDGHATYMLASMGGGRLKLTMHYADGAAPASHE